MNAPQRTTPAGASPGLGPGSVLAPGAAVYLGRAAATNELARRILVFGALLGWCAILVIFRMRQAANFTYAFMEWNLLLAVVPAVAAWLFAKAAAKRSRS